MIPLDIKFLRALDALCLLNSSDLVRLANASIVKPIDNLILEIALCDPEDHVSIESIKTKLFEREGLGKFEKYDAIKYFGLIVCKDIIKNRIDAIDGAKELSRVLIASDLEDFSYFDPFVYAASEAESRPQELDFFRKAIKKEAERLIKGLQ